MKTSKSIPTFENFEKKSQRIVEISGALAKDLTIFPMKVKVRFEPTKDSDVYTISLPNSMGMGSYNFMMSGPHGQLMLSNVAKEQMDVITKSIGKTKSASLIREKGLYLVNVLAFTKDVLNKFTSNLKKLGFTEEKDGGDLLYLGTANDEAGLEQIVNAFKI